MEGLQENIQFTEQGKFTPKGKIKLELFDAETGEKTSEHTKHNYVKQDIVDYATMMGRYKNFEHGIYVGGSRFFDSIVLTDADNPTQPLTERLLEGNVKGAGIIGDQASNALYGAWNPVESVLSDAYYKLVFDFPTSSGNGTFQSIYTTRKDSKYPTYMTLLPPFDSGVRVSAMSTQPTNFYTQGGNIYRTEGNKFYKYRLPVFNIGKYNDSYPLEVEQEYTIPFICQGYTIKGNDIYFVDYSYKVYKAPLSNPSSTTVIKTFTTSEFAGSAFGIEYIPKNNVFAIYSNGNNNLYLFSSDFETKLGQTAVSIGSEALRMYVPKNCPNRLVAGNITIDVDTLKEVRNVVYPKYGECGELSSGVCFYKATSSDSKQYTLASSSQFFSRVLLDAPVTKTPQNTMKITYEFNIPPVEFATF